MPRSRSDQVVSKYALSGSGRRRLHVVAFGMLVEDADKPYAVANCSRLFYTCASHTRTADVDSNRTDRFGHK